MGGLYQFQPEHRSRTRADRRHDRPAPSSRLPYTGTAAPGLGRVDGHQNTRRTGGLSPGRDPPQIFISKSSGARRTNPPVNVVRKRPGHVQQFPRRYGRGVRWFDGRAGVGGFAADGMGSSGRVGFPLGNQKKITGELLTNSISLDIFGYTRARRCCRRKKRG